MIIQYCLQIESFEVRNDCIYREWKKVHVFIPTLGVDLEEIIAFRKWIKKKRIRTNRTTEEDTILVGLLLWFTKFMYTITKYY